MRYILLLPLALTSCEGISVDLDNKHLTGTYSAKRGLVIVPKAPKGIVIIEPAK